MARLISPIYQFQITVNSTNDAPQITGQKVITILEDQNYSIPFDDLTVVDPDNILILRVSQWRYCQVQTTRFTGQTITPTPNFNGSLSVNVRVNDGQANSNTWPLVITVTPVNDPPAITNQSPLSTNEEIPITLVPGNFTITGSGADHVHLECASIGQPELHVLLEIKLRQASILLVHFLYP